MYLRRTLGRIYNKNKYLIKDLIEINMWNKDIKDQIVLNYGSVQSLDIPQK